MRGRKRLTGSRGRVTGKRRAAAALLAFGVAALGCTAFFQWRIRPILAAIAESRAKNIAIQAVNDAVWQVLGDEEIKYDSLVEVTTTADGRVSSIKADSVKLNTLCSDIRGRITDYFSDLSERIISIPVGSLTGIDMLAGRGPSVHIAITLSGSSETQVVNDFESAGINQTRHQMILSTVTKVYVIMQSGNLSTSVENSIVIAETVIVGEVPEIYSDGSNELWQNLVGYSEE